MKAFVILTLLGIATVGRAGPLPQAQAYGGGNWLSFGCRILDSIDDFSSLCESNVLKHDGTPVDTNRSFFRVPVISWYIPDDRKQVLICRHIGPRYGNGGWWDVIGQGPRGMLVAAEREAWIA